MTLSLLFDYGPYIVGFLGVFLVAYWTFDERDQSGSIGETIERVGERARSTTGGVFGAAGSLAVVAVSIIVTIGSELVTSSMRIVEIVGMDPVLSGGVLTGLLGTLGLSGTVNITALQFLALVGLFLIAGTIWRERTQA